MITKLKQSNSSKQGDKGIFLDFFVSEKMGIGPMPTRHRGRCPTTRPDVTLQSSQFNIPFQVGSQQDYCHVSDFLLTPVSEAYPSIGVTGTSFST
jgi:hypothetical protein